MPKTPHDQSYEVKIFYREPLYELWSGRGRRPPYVARYRRITARNHREAVQIARDRFENLARDSAVKWERKVVEVRVEPLGF